MKKRRGLLSLLIALSFAVTGCGTPSGQGVLKVGVRNDIVNFGYLNPTTGKYYGLEIDLADRLARDLGYERAEYVTVRPENRKQMLMDGEVDCLIAAYSISDTRLENFDFSPAYYSDYSRIMVERSSMVGSIDELPGKRIGVLSGTDAAPVFADKMKELGLAQDAAGGVDFVKMETYDELDLALEEGAVDAVCMDGCIARAYLDDDRMFLEDTLYQENYGVATQKGSMLSGRVAESVQKMLDDGTVAALIDKWD